MVGGWILPTLDLAQGIPTVPTCEPACFPSLGGGGIGGDLAEGPLLGGGGWEAILRKAPPGWGWWTACASLRPFLFCIMTWLSWLPCIISLEVADGNFRLPTFLSSFVNQHVAGNLTL